MSDWDSFRPGTGLKEDFDGTITEATFLPGTAGPNMQMIFEVAADDGDEVILRYGIGPDWHSDDGGLSVTHPRGRALFNSSTAYSDFMVHAMEAGAGIELRKRDKDTGGRAATMAETWKGLRFHWDVLERPTRRRNDDTGEWVNDKTARTLPVSFLGTVNSSNQQQVTVADPLSTLDAATVVKLKKAARTSATYDSFVDAVIAMETAAGESVVALPGVSDALADEGWWKELRGAEESGR